jgi:16S rRNA (adenine1518-N6/adenine1519-N6)-dimethyltransferase
VRRPDAEWPGWAAADDAARVTLTRTEVHRLLEAHGLSPSRALGQNFVADPNTVRRIARLAGVGPGDAVLEIGAGLGCLTLALAETGAHVTAVEVDKYVVPVLRDVVSATTAVVIEADAMTADWSSVLGGHARWTLVANLPYNISTPLVLDLLDHVPAIDRMLVMVQREVGERLAAAPGHKAYGIPSVKVAYWATGQVVGKVPASVFIPEPNIESVLVRIDRRDRPATDADPEQLFRLVRTAFGQRRKMLRRSLAADVTDAAFARAGIRPEARPEELDVVQWGALAIAVDQINRSHQ